MDGTDIVKTKRSAGMMEDNTDAGFSPILRRRLMTVDRISGFLQGASMPLRPRVSPIVTVRAAIRYEALAHDETALARRARLAWLAYRMAVADGLFRNVTDPAVMDGLRWMLSTGSLTASCSTQGSRPASCSPPRPVTTRMGSFTTSLPRSPRGVDPLWPPWAARACRVGIPGSLFSLQMGGGWVCFG